MPTLPRSDSTLEDNARHAWGVAIAFMNGTAVCVMADWQFATCVCGACSLVATLVALELYRDWRVAERAARRERARLPGPGRASGGRCGHCRAPLTVRDPAVCPRCGGPWPFRASRRRSPGDR